MLDPVLEQTINTPVVAFMQLHLLEWVGCDFKVQANHQIPAADRENRMEFLKEVKSKFCLLTSDYISQVSLTEVHIHVTK